MPPIEGNFDKELQILWNGRGVAARGPLRWFRSSDEKRKEKSDDYSVALHVAIMQNGVAAMGRTGDDIPQNANEFLVAAAVQGSATLKPGPATATGLALLRGDTVAMYQWQFPVMLKAKEGANESSPELVEVLSQPISRPNSQSTKKDRAPTT
jgi:hypothetical protein